MSKSYRDQSRTNFASESVTSETVNTGSLQRIADAVEIMAKDRVQLERDLNWYKKAYADRGQEIRDLESRIKGLKITKSRYKNELDRLKQAAKDTNNE